MNNENAPGREGSGPALPIVVTAVWGVAFFPGLFAAAMSVTFFDAPGSMSNPAAWINAVTVASFPVLCVFSIAGSWIAWSLQRRRLARTPSLAQLVVAGLPLLPVAYVVIALVFAELSVLLSGQPLGLHSTEIKH